MTIVRINIKDQLHSIAQCCKLSLVIFFALFASCTNQPSKSREIDERLKLGSVDESPMGGAAFKYITSKAFTSGTIIENKRPFDKWHQAFLTDYEERNNNVYIVVAPAIKAYKDEVQALSDFLERGNTVLLFADEFAPYLLQQFSIELGSDLSMFSSAADLAKRDTKKYLYDTSLFKQHSFQFYFNPFDQWLQTDSTVNKEVIGLNDFHHADAIRLLYGRGQLIIVTNAYAATNYFLLSHNNHQYATGLLSYLPANPTNIFWDDFYRKQTFRQSEGNNGSLLYLIFQTPGLLWAFWLLILLILAWMISNFIRRQRMIPVIKPNVNSSLEFTQTIARLYFNKKDNRNIALKMIAYFQDHVRSKYYMNYTGINDEFARILTAKTGLDVNRIKQLVDTIKQVQQSEAVDDLSLLKLNGLIQEVLNKK